MTDKEVRQLSRAQLISLLAEVTGENEELKAEVGRLKEEIGKLTVTDEKLEQLEKISLKILYRLYYPDGAKGRQGTSAASGKEGSSAAGKAETADRGNGNASRPETRTARSTAQEQTDGEG